MGTTLASDDERILHLEVLHAPPTRPLDWLRLGWRDLRRHWSASLGYGALIAAFGWTVLVFCAIHPYLVAAAISGFLLVGPLMSAGLCEMSRRYSRGQSASFDDSLEGFARNAPALFEFGVVLAACAALWFAISAVMLDEVFRVSVPRVAATIYEGFLDSANRSQILAYVAVGGVLAVGVFAASVVAVPLIIDRHATAVQAIRASMRAVSHNVPAMIVWSAVILALTIVGYAPLLFGLVLIVPLLGHASWHAYKGLIR